MSEKTDEKRGVISGWLLMLGVAVVSRVISNAIVVEGSHPLEAIVVAIVLGIGLRNAGLVPKACFEGVSRFEKVLVLGIVLLGASLTLEILKIEPYALVVLAVTMLVGFWSIYFLTRKIGFGEKLGTLLAVGTTICGGTAIAITSPLIEAKQEETGYALGTIAIWGLIALFVYPYLAHLFSFSQTVFGVWASTAIHSTPQVVGAGYLFGDRAGQIATMVKLTRNIFMIPLAFVIGVWYLKKKISLSKKQAGQQRVSSGDNPGQEQMRKGADKWKVIAKGFPWFLLGYVVMALLRGFGFFTPSGVHYFTVGGKFLILMGMAGIGLNTDLKKMVRLGARPFIAGFIASIIVAAVSLVMIRAVGIW